MLFTFLSKFPKEFVIATVTAVVIVDIIVASTLVGLDLPEGKRVRFGFYKTTDKKG